MFSQVAFGRKLKGHRKAMGLTQDEAATRIGVSAQAVSKWEKGECLPDVYNLKLLGRLYRVSIDSLLYDDDELSEKVIETIRIGEAVFEVVEKPAAIFAGRILCAKNYANISGFHAAIGVFNDDVENRQVLDNVTGCVLPVCDIHMSVNFWRAEKLRAFGFVRETEVGEQPDGIDVYQMPASLFVRAYTDAATAQLLAKKQCEIWELFAYIRNYFMPEHSFAMAENGAQEMEVFDTAKRTTGYAYMPVVRR